MYFRNGTENVFKKLRNEHQNGFSDKKDIIYTTESGPPQH